MKRGYSAIGIYEPKTVDNLGTLVRSAYCFGADFVFTIGNRYTRQASDTTDGTKHMPLFHYRDADDFLDHLPSRSSLVGVEITLEARPLERFIHPERAIYLLGGEDRTLPGFLLAECEYICQMDTKFCLNVASAGTVVLYDRSAKGM